MRTTLDLDAKLLAEAMKVINAKTKTEAIEAGLQALLDADNRRRLILLAGSDPDAKAAPRRRSAP